MQASTKFDESDLPRRRLTPIYATAFMSALLFFILSAPLPFYLTTANNTNALQIGMALAFPSIVGFVFAQLYSRLRKCFSFQNIELIVFFSLGACLLIISISAAYEMVLVGAVLGGGGVGLLSPNNSGWAASVTPVGTRSRAVGLLTCSIFLGQFFSSILSQLFVNEMGLAGTFALMAVVSGVIAVIFLFMGMREKKPDVLKKSP